MIKNVQDLEHETDVSTGFYGKTNVSAPNKNW